MKTCKHCGREYPEGEYKQHTQSLAHMRGVGRRK